MRETRDLTLYCAHGKINEIRQGFQKTKAQKRLENTTMIRFVFIMAISGMIGGFVGFLLFGGLIGTVAGTVIGMKLGSWFDDSVL